MLRQCWKCHTKEAFAVFFKMIMGTYVHLYDFGKTCALIIIFTNASHFAPLKLDLCDKNNLHVN